MPEPTPIRAVLHTLCAICLDPIPPERQAVGSRFCCDDCNNRWVAGASDEPKRGTGPFGARENWQ